MRKVQFVFTLLILINLFSSCSKNDSSPTQEIPAGNFQGMVTDDYDGSAVEGASISTTPNTFNFVTDKTGKYLLSNVPVGQYYISASKSMQGVQKASGLGPVFVKAGETTVINLQLPLNGPKPSSPLLIYPKDSSINQQKDLTLQWGESSEASSYILQISINNAFTSYVLNKGDIKTGSYQIIGLNPSTTYFWRVIASNKYGLTSSSIFSFTTVQ